jgi:hypothetical protein
MRDEGVLDGERVQAEFRLYDWALINADRHGHQYMIRRQRVLFDESLKDQGPDDLVIAALDT